MPLYFHGPTPVSAPPWADVSRPTDPPWAMPPSSEPDKSVNPAWRFIPVQNRRPLYKLPTNLAPGVSPGEVADADMYWEGGSATWRELKNAVADGYEVALLPERSNLVVIDCDSDGKFISRSDSSAYKLAVTFGIDQLLDLAARLGKELPATHTVSTRTTGHLQLYFAQHRLCEVTSRNQVPGRWAIDIKASRNSWVAAPPTPGYSSWDIPVATLPYWLARYIRDSWPRSRRPVLAGSRSGGGRQLGPGARAGILAYVAGSQAGGWNNAIYWAGCRFGEAGAGLDETVRAVTDAAGPWTCWDQDSAEKSARSGWRRGSSDRGHR